MNLFQSVNSKSGGGEGSPLGTTSGNLDFVEGDLFAVCLACQADPVNPNAYQSSLTKEELARLRTAKLTLDESSEGILNLQAFIEIPQLSVDANALTQSAWMYSQTENGPQAIPLGQLADQLGLATVSAHVSIELGNFPSGISSGESAGGQALQTGLSKSFLLTEENALFGKAPDFSGSSFDLTDQQQSFHVEPLKPQFETDDAGQAIDRGLILQSNELLAPAAEREVVATSASDQTVASWATPQNAVRNELQVRNSEDTLEVMDAESMETLNGISPIQERGFSQFGESNSDDPAKTPRQKKDAVTGGNPTSEGTAFSAHNKFELSPIATDLSGKAPIREFATSEVDLRGIDSTVKAKTFDPNVVSSVIDQVVDGLTIDAISLTNGKELSLQITPAELGRLIIRVLEDDSALTAHIYASEAATTEILNREKGHLINMLREQGLDLTDLDISHRESREQETADEQTSHQPHERHSAMSRAAPNHSLPRPYSSHRSSLVDVIA